MDRQFGWDLPPGVSTSMIPGNRPEDELADMIADGWRPHCEVCGAFLPIEPSFVEPWEDALECSGTITKHVRSYNDGTHEGILEIIGEEHRHDTYEEYISECGEYFAAGDTHEPHKEVMAFGVHEYRYCKNCKFENKLTTM